MKAQSRVLIIGILLMGSAYTLFATPAQSWLFLNLNTELSEKETASVQVWDRDYNKEDKKQHLYFINLAYKRAISKNTKAYAGVFNMFYVQESKADALELSGNDFELRPWQGLYHKVGKIGQTSVGSFTRLEERFIYKNNYDFDLRFRERLSLAQPIGKKLGLKVTSEILINLDDDASGRLFAPQEMRHCLSFNMKVYDSLKVEAGYGVFLKNKADNHGIWIVSMNYLFSPWSR
ncbi:MAG: DUF2490 domain-containing protein [Bacteroidota bacterium]